MKRLLLFLLVSLTFPYLTHAQNIQFYESEEGEKHIWGSFPLEYLNKDTTYAKWYQESYEKFDLKEPENQWAKNLSNTKVDIYLGTWCGDSKEWVPQFVKLWDQLGLNRDQLHFTALHDADEYYKQGPNREEEGLNIHRVPTFIFKEEGKEYARIVESPSTDLLTDVAQIALGYPSAPNYAGASHMLNLFDELSMDSIYKNFNKLYQEVYYKTGRYAELNTLGRVLEASDKQQQALMVYQMNSGYHYSNWRAHNSLAKLYSKMKYYGAAIKTYERVIKLDPENEAAKTELERLKPLAAKQRAEMEKNQKKED